MARKLSDKGLTKKLDNRWSVLVREKVDNVCEVCGSKDNVQAHHIVGRANWRLRWEIKNGVSLCSKHHKFDSRESAHLNPLWFDDWLKVHHSKEVRWLKSKQNETKSWKRFEKELLWDILSEVEDVDNFVLPLDEDCYLS